MRMRRANVADAPAPTRSDPPSASFVAQCFLGPSAVPLDPALGRMRLLRLDASSRARDVLRMVLSAPTTVSSSSDDIIVRPALGDGTPNASVPTIAPDAVAARAEGFAFPYMLWVGTARDYANALRPPWEQFDDCASPLPLTMAGGGGGSSDDDQEEEEEEGAGTSNGRSGGASGTSRVAVASRGADPLSFATSRGGESEGGVQSPTILTIEATAPELPLSPGAGPAVTPSALGSKPPPTPASAAHRRQTRQRREEERRRREAVTAKREAALQAKADARRAAEEQARREAAERELDFERRREADRAGRIYHEERREELKAQLMREKAAQHVRRESRLESVRRQYEEMLGGRGDQDASMASSSPVPSSTGGGGVGGRLSMASSSATASVVVEPPTGGPLHIDDASAPSSRAVSRHRRQTDDDDPAIVALDASCAASALEARSLEGREREALRARVQDGYLRHLVATNTQRKALVKRDARARAADALGSIQFGAPSAVVSRPHAAM